MTSRLNLRRGTIEASSKEALETQIIVSAAPAEETQTQADQPEPEANPGEPAAAEGSTGEEMQEASSEQRDALAGLVRDMLRRPATIDIEGLIGQLSQLKTPSEADRGADPGPKATENTATPGKEKTDTADTNPTGPSSSSANDIAAGPSSATDSADPTENSATPGKKETDTADTNPTGPNSTGKKAKRNRENETDEERLHRESHNSYMRFYRSIRI